MAPKSKIQNPNSPTISPWLLLFTSLVGGIAFVYPFFLPADAGGEEAAHGADAPLIFVLFAPKYTGTGYWFAAAGFYLVAKLLEHFDSQVYAALGVMSGHPLKHVAAATACYCIYLVFRDRKPVA